MNASFSTTHPLYLQDDLLMHATGTVIRTGHDEIKKRKYHWVQLDQTIFYPQGGGQLSDKGTLNGIPVEYVHRVENIGRPREFAILHCFSKAPGLEVGQVVDLSIDAATRHEYSRWHTAAHVVGHVVELLWPHLKACGGNCFPGEAYMKFMIDPKDLDKSLSVEEFEQECQNFCDKRPLMEIRTKEDGTRKLHIGDFEGVDCGGTHLHDLSELGKISVAPGKPNRKTNTLTIKYSLA